MKSEKLSIKPKIMELNDTNDIYMTLNIVILSNDVNYNNAEFLDDFIDGVIENKETYIGIPFVVNREKLESSDYSNLTHELKDGELLTDQIGSFVDFWKDEIDGANCLLGSIRVFKRFPKTCESILELYDNNNLETSCEVLVNSYSDITDGVRKIHYNDGKNALIGSAIVTYPAEKRAKATLLVAEAYKKDLENLNKKGDVNVSEEIKFNKGFETRFHNEIETAALKFSDIRNQIYNTLNPVNPSSGSRNYNFYLRDLYNEFVIAEDWNNEQDLYKIPYSIANDQVSISAKEQWQKGTLGFIPEGVDMDKMMKDYQSKMMELQSQLDQAKEELQAMSETKTVEVQELETKVTELQSKIDELNGLLVSEKEAKTNSETELNSKVTELQSEVDSLKVYKENFEKAEKENAIAELNAKYSKLISEETFKSEEVQNAITELNSQKLNEIVVAEIAKEKTITETASKTDGDVTIVASKQEDLIPQNVLQKYGIEA